MSADGREQQRALYGEPIADIAGRVLAALGFTQARLADTLQLSAPMLSQLISGNRVKIGNPAVVHRLQALAELAQRAATLSADEVDARVRAIRDEHPTLTGTVTTDLARRQAALAELAAAASGVELERLARLTTVPGLATLLRDAAGRRG